MRKRILVDGGLSFESTTTLRVAKLVYRLTLGARMTTAEVASTLGITRQGAWVMLDQIAGSHDVPLTGPAYGDDETHWYILPKKDDERPGRGFMPT